MILTADDGYQRYLVCWKGHPQSNCTLVWTEELQQLNPALLDEVPSSSFTRGKHFRPEEVDEDLTRIWRTYYVRVPELKLGLIKSKSSFTNLLLLLILVGVLL